MIVSKYVLAELNKANLDIRQQYLNQQVEFVEDQTREAGSALRASEDSLLKFYDANRTYQSSPTLVFQESRLKRRVDLAQSVYMGLAQQLEQAKITAAQNTPVYSLVDAPIAPEVRAF